MTPKTLILALETSSRVGSVAIAAGQRMLDEITFSGPMKHSSEIFPAICNLLIRFEKKSQDIKQVYISVGPGSFTGLRIAVTLAKLMHLANSVKIVPVDTLDVIAAKVTTICHSDRSEESPETIAPILDAKRGQFYIAVYKKQLTAENAKNAEKEKELKLNSATSANSAVKGWKKAIPDSLMTADEFLERFACKENPIWLLGDGLLYHKDKFKADGVCFFDEEFWSPRASKVHQLGWQLALANKFADPILLTPNYLLRPEVTLKRK